MGGMGSGGWNKKHRPTTADAFALDVGSLRRAGALVPGWSGGWQWTRNGERAADIRINATDTGLVLNYRTRTGTSPWREVSQGVLVHWMPCRFGGKRPLLCCPKCGRSGVKLWLLGAVACRTCHGLTYPVQTESEDDRLFRRANKIRIRLGGEPGLSYSLPRRPKGMHHRTYDRLTREIFDIEWQLEAMLSAKWQRICSRLGLEATGLDFP
ncbi:hypothetical protein [Magnetospirillum sp. 64-120]|uniref:hypothetical protein n=1 Tax=Magnetospirillum sp. 64-120 TaxID=1895778 RepID=UPI00092CB393|nr:hypothetical protein [Magnetospirillum sp. 64-120]OJX74829.1 MAG: hypothetical protein BGO92_14945 [Magnetospirillum sp. 64-120]